MNIFKMLILFTKNKYFLGGNSIIWLRINNKTTPSSTKNQPYMLKTAIKKVSTFCPNVKRKSYRAHVLKVHSNDEKLVSSFICQNKLVSKKFKVMEEDMWNFKSTRSPMKVNKLFLTEQVQKYLLLSEHEASLSQSSIRNTFMKEHNSLLNGTSHIRNYSPLLMTTRPFSTVSNSDDVIKQDNTTRISPVTSEKIPNAPKNVLHNVYTIVAQELNNRDLKIQPVYNVVKSKNKQSSWCCTYQIKWPDPKKFVSVGQTKKEASHKAAVSALLWLQNQGKLTKEGFPIVVGKEEIEEMSSKKRPIFKLNPNIMEEMESIINVYEKKFVPSLSNNLQDNDDPHPADRIINEDVDLNILRKKNFTPSKYFARENTMLPISKYKEEFIQLLRENRVIIVKGEPGCGKSTRIPQYILEAWAREGLNLREPCQIAVTQPRRIAAVSLADRVSDERGEHCGHIVGYQIRLKSNFNPQTGRILYCTTGILLKHFETDVNLSNFTHVILDEAHERDVNTDLLLNLLKKAMETNHDLKLIVMSATINTDLFKDYLDGPPIMHIPGFTYPVNSYFLDDLKNLNLSKSSRISTDETENPLVIHKDVADLILHIHKKKREGGILCFLPGWEDIVKVEKLIPKSSDVAVLCLHSRLQDTDQRRIFSRTPPGVRKIILSTNIAETSITVDDVVYVVDTGIHKESRFDHEKGVQCIDNYWISKSNTRQRKGRAGRVQPGECFHLYTKSRYDSLVEFPDPEILKTSLTKIALNSKIYSNNMNTLEFMGQLPTPPEKNATRRAVRELKELKLLDDNEILTPLGRTLAKFQLEPKLAKVLVNAAVYKCLTPVVDVVTIFSAGTELFSSALKDKEHVKSIKSQESKYSDHLAMMRLYEAWLEIMEEKSFQEAERFCEDFNLVSYKIVTVDKLRKMNFEYLREGIHQVMPLSDDYSDNDELVKAILFSGVGNLLRHRNWEIVKGRCKKTHVFYTNHNQKATISSESVNSKKGNFPSDFLVYFNETRSNSRRSTVIRESSVLSPLAVLLFSDKDLNVRESGKDEESVVLTIKDTKVEFLCPKEDAHHILKCKEALKSAYSYFIYQMTEGGEYNETINETWDQILQHLNNILLCYNTDN